MKTTLVLLPGLNGTTGLFTPLLELIDGQFNVLPIAYPTNEEKSYNELSNLVLDKLDTVTGKYIILGESFSGPVALFVAQNNPTGLSGLVLVASFIRAPNLKCGRFLPWGLGFSLAKPLYSITAPFDDKKDQSLISKISTEMKTVSPRVLAARINDIFAVEATEALRNCPVPAIYFRGTRDFVVPAKNLTDILSTRPDVRHVEFNTHHFLLQTRPAQALKEIEMFAATCTMR